VLEDRLNHASLLDSGWLSGATFARYAHNDAAAAAALLAKRGRRTLDADVGARSVGGAARYDRAGGEARSEGSPGGHDGGGAGDAGGAGDGGALVLTDGVFSMDGDVAPLRALAAACREHRAWLAVDDAHGLGTLGPRGGGALALHGCTTDDVPVLVGTLGKAFGTFGAFVAGSEALVELFVQKARTYIYTTALPPAVAAAARTALAIARDEEWRRERLAALVARFRSGVREIGLPLVDSATPIQPVILGAPAAALAASDALRGAARP
jgi:8-amino-7-oxononanoate synthase